MPRMTTKRWMIVVAAIAILFSRPARFRSLARAHKRELEKILVNDFQIYLATVPGQGDSTSDFEVAKSAAKPILDALYYHYNMQEKYEEAFRRPWLPVAADPPAPPMPSKEYQEAFRRRFVDDLYRDSPLKPPALPAR